MGNVIEQMVNISYTIGRLSPNHITAESPDLPLQDTLSILSVDGLGLVLTGKSQARRQLVEDTYASTKYDQRTLCE